MDQKNSTDIEAWKRVHLQLTMAVVQSHDNIAKELTKRRYLLEEMNRCKMQKSECITKAKKKTVPKKIAPKKSDPIIAIEASQTVQMQHLPDPSATDAVANLALDVSLAEQIYNTPPAAQGMYDPMSLAFQILNQKINTATEEDISTNDGETEEEKTE